MNPVIEWKDVSKHFGPLRALDRLSLEVSPGQVFALLGENGAGKSTAIRSLLGLIDPDRGSAHVLGMNARTHGRQIRQQIGYVPDQPSLYEWMTVDQIGWFSAGFAPAGFLDDYRERVRAFDLNPRAKIKNLSKGMKAKVNLALALAGDPAVLIMDEPTSGLDVIVRRAFLESMVDVAGAGRTVLLSSHQIAEVERVADTVAILHQGKIVVCDELDRLKQEIRSVTLVGNPPEVNRWPGEVLLRETKGRQTKLIIRTSAETDLAVTAHSLQVEHVEVRPVSLEEIFVAYIAGSPTPRRQEVLQ